MENLCGLKAGAWTTSKRGVIFQSFALFPWFTALGNVEFALKTVRIR